MASYGPTSRDLTVALAASLVAHAGLVVALAETRLPTPVEPEPVLVAFAPESFEPDRIDPVDDPVRPGIAESASDSPNWLGFDEQTPHEAPESLTEQSALALEQPGGGEPVLAEASAAPAVAAEPAESADPAPPAQTEPEPPADDSALDLAQATDPAQPPSAPETIVSPPPALRPGPTIGPGRAERNGILSDKESVATALKNATNVRPGQVLAGEGLDIKTRAPTWHITTRFTTVPRNPVVRVTFGRDGRVLRAAFLADDKTTYSTGAAEVDKPLLQAIYRWTATGEELSKLPVNDPQAGITMTFRIILLGA